MFFKMARTKAKSSVDEVRLSMETHREDIKRRMAVVEEVSSKLVDAVKKTAEESSTVTAKVNRELKIAKKTLTTISSKLNEGMVLLDYNGHITHLNKAAEKIFDIDEKDVIGKYLDDVVLCDSPVMSVDGDEIKKPVLTHDFFSVLSRKIFISLQTNSSKEKYVICNQALCDAVPFCIASDSETILEVKVLCKGVPITLNVTLTVLDNDPECLRDVSYVFLFQRS